jgi:S-adenosylmethionine:tRNA-ribosyltransferase-isomerase (queuine synthetase)
MSDEIIIQQLREKENYLNNELNKVRLALKAFIKDNIYLNYEDFRDRKETEVMVKYRKEMTYNDKILFVLSNCGQPMLVDEITAEINQLEPDLEFNKLHRSVSHTLSMLAKYGKVKKHAYNRKIKYSIRTDVFQE